MVAKLLRYALRIIQKSMECGKLRRFPNNFNIQKKIVRPGFIKNRCFNSPIEFSSLPFPLVPGEGNQKVFTHCVSMEDDNPLPKK